jgi:RNA polymerase sigma-70 factor (ECF subfamily)
MVTNYNGRPDVDIELAESLTMAFMIMLETLAPQERAAFLLREVFEYDYLEIAGILDKSEASCRQTIHRAKERLAKRHRRFEPSREETDLIATRFLQAARTGDVQTLMSLFDENAVMMSDGGGKVRAALNPVHGPDSIARFVVGVARKGVPADASIVLTEVNGQTAIVVFQNDQAISATILDIRDGMICNLFIIVNPVKLRWLTPGL